MADKKTTVKIAALGITVALVVLILFSGDLINRAQATGNLGLSFVITYTDGTKRIANTANFATFIPMQGVYDTDKLISSITVFVLVKTSKDFSGAFDCQADIIWDETIKSTVTVAESLTVLANKPSGFNIQTLSSDMLLQWGAENETKFYNLKVEVKNTGKVVSGQEVIYFNGQTFILPLKVDRTVTGTQPPVSPPPTQPVIGSLKVTGTYNSQAVSFEAWYIVNSTTSAHVVAPTAGYTWTGLPVGTYTVYGKYSTITKSSTTTVISGQTASVSFNFGATPTLIFSDGFEGTWPSSTWTTITTSGDTISKSSVAYAGSWSLAHMVDGSSTGEQAYSTRDLGVQYAAGYYRCYVRFDVLPTAGKSFALLNIRPRLEQPGTSAFVEVAGANFRLAWRDATANATLNYVYTGKTLNANTWYCIQVYVSVGNPGTVTFWVDGTQAYTIAAVNNEWGGVRYVQIGERWTAALTPHTIFIDEVAVDDVYINP
jgi:hypothetical protein